VPIVSAHFRFPITSICRGFIVQLVLQRIRGNRNNKLMVFEQQMVKINGKLALVMWTYIGPGLRPVCVDYDMNHAVSEL